MSENNKPSRSESSRNKLTTSKKGAVRTIKTVDEDEKYRNKGLVVVDFNTVWCGPCKKFAPVFEQMASKYPGVMFLSVDAEAIEHEDCENLSSVPTFKIFLNGDLRREFSGVDKERLEKYIERYEFQIFKNGSLLRSFTVEEREAINNYMKTFDL